MTWNATKFNGNVHSCFGNATALNASLQDRSSMVGLKRTGGVLNIPFFTNNPNTSMYKWNESLTARISPFRKPLTHQPKSVLARLELIWDLSVRGAWLIITCIRIGIRDYLRSDSHVFKFHPWHENSGINDRRMPQIKIGLSAKCTLDGRMALAFQIYNRWLGLDRASDCHTQRPRRFTILVLLSLWRPWTTDDYN